MIVAGEEERKVPALTYVVDRSHVQYAGNLSRTKLLAQVWSSAGKSGGNAEYVINTVRHLRAASIRDETLEWLAAALGGEGDGKS